ncbi:MAG: hypothetical protein UD936_03155 [Acutalibacteraceae bacterium]|nr:hypothetical protein [Acutalibacteraceae bacterium]
MKCERCGYENFAESHYCKKCWAELNKSGAEGSDYELSRYRSRSNYQPGYQVKKDVYDGNNRYLKGLYNSDTDNNSNTHRRYSDNNTTRYNNITYLNRQYSSSGNTQYGNNSAYGSGGYSITDNSQYDNNAYGSGDYLTTDNSQYDNNAYGSGDYLSTDNSQYDNNAYSSSDYSATDNSQYDNNAYGSSDYSATDNSQDNNNAYGSSDYSATDNSAYTDSQYSSPESEQYDGGLPFSIYNGYHNSQYNSNTFHGSMTDVYNTQSSVYNSESAYNKYKKTPYYTDETREQANRRIKNIISFAGIIPVVIYLLFYVMLETDVSYRKPDVIDNDTVIQATQPTIPVAELGNSLETIKTTEGNSSFKAMYHPPEGYSFADSIVESHASYECDIYDKTVSLTTMFVNDDVQKEVDYYKKLAEREGTTVAMGTFDADAGKVTEILVATQGKGINYQVYIEAEVGCTVYISMTNVPLVYQEDAEKLMDLLIDDIEISPVALPVEEITDTPTE